MNPNAAKSPTVLQQSDNSSDIRVSCRGGSTFVGRFLTVAGARFGRRKVVLDSQDLTSTWPTAGLRSVDVRLRKVPK